MINCGFFKLLQSLNHMNANVWCLSPIGTLERWCNIHVDDHRHYSYSDRYQNVNLQRNLISQRAKGLVKFVSYNEVSLY